MPRLLNLLGEDPALDAQALVGDRVDGGHPLDEAGEHDQRDPAASTPTPSPVEVTSSTITPITATASTPFR